MQLVERIHLGITGRRLLTPSSANQPEQYCLGRGTSEDRRTSPLSDSIVCPGCSDNMLYPTSHLDILNEGHVDLGRELIGTGQQNPTNALNRIPPADLFSRRR